MLHFSWQKSEPLFKKCIIHSPIIFPWDPEFREIQSFNRIVHSFGIVCILSQTVSLYQRKIICIRSDPVRHDQKPRKDHLRFHTDIRKFFYTGKSTFFKCCIQPFFPYSFPLASLLSKKYIFTIVFYFFFYLIRTLIGCLTMMGTNNYRNSDWYPILSQNAFSTQRMRYPISQFFRVNKFYSFLDDCLTDYFHSLRDV